MTEQRRTADELLACLIGKVRSPRDWAPVIELASQTLTIGTLADAALADDDLTTDVRDLLIDVRNRARRRNDRLIRQLAELLPMLNAAGIRPIVMRGMARLLSSPDEKTRLLSDIDLLVPGASRHRCVEALAALNYKVLKATDGQPIDLGRPEDVGMVDLHTALQPDYMQLEYERLAPHCRTVELGAGRALLPTPTCQLLLNVVHDQLHDADYWRGLIDFRHLLDFPRLVAAGVDWELLASFFPAGCASTALHVQLRTARSLLEIDIPDEYCGRKWARLQVARRRLQIRHPYLMTFFTLVSIAVDPPPKRRVRTGRENERMWKRLRRKFTYLRPASNGKLLVPAL